MRVERLIFVRDKKGKRRKVITGKLMKIFDLLVNNQIGRSGESTGLCGEINFTSQSLKTNSVKIKN